MTAMLARKPKVAVLGPKGTFSDEAAQSKWGDDAEYLYQNQLTGIFEKVETGEVDYGIVPTEDSEEGDVQESLTLMREYPLYVIDELKHDVEHCLLSKGKIEQIKTIGSHYQVLRHCRKYLYTYFPDVKQDRTESTVAAIEKALEDPTYAAIASEENAERYNLNILKKEIHDKGRNTTRFLVLSPVEKAVPLNILSKTSLLINTNKDTSGVLVKILNIFAKKNINLSRLAPRPQGGSLGKYLFFLDIEGNKKDPKVQAAIKETKSLDFVSSVRDFGTYPRLRSKPEEEIKLSPDERLKSTFSFWNNEEDRAYDSLY
ncbi:P-protein [archaeon BMS3Abin16]|nr:P-protein [archaeon BMS3Abin16]HDY73813.1 prephenate dehydratase [Euryarchaeota archaeon]